MHFYKVFHIVFINVNPIFTCNNNINITTFKVLFLLYYFSITELAELYMSEIERIYVVCIITKAKYSNITSILILIQ